MKRKLIGRAAALLTAMALATPSVVAAPDQSPRRYTGPNIIRDAEIEGLLRIYAGPIFKAANINADSAKVVVIGDPSINAFVANGQRIFINSGLITRSPTPNTVIGVLAHESGHIAGGHLARLNSAMAEASTQAIIGTLVGMAAMVGAAAAGSGQAAQAGTGVILGSQSAAQRGLLVYQRAMEATADESAIRYLGATHQSAKGMLELFHTLANEALAMTAGADPYAYTHPMPFDRIRALEADAQASPYYNTPDSPTLLLRHKLAQAKLIGFLQPQQVFLKFPSTDHSMPARYAQSIAFFRRGDLAAAMPLIDSLTQEMPNNPYFWELKAQAYLENNKADLALPAIVQAREILPENGLLQILHAQILLAPNSPAKADEAIGILRRAQRSESESPEIFKFLGQAYALKNDLPMTTLETAEFAYATGDMALAAEKANLAKANLKPNTPEWYRASDLVTYAGRKKQ